MTKPTTTTSAGAPDNQHLFAASGRGPVGL